MTILMVSDDMDFKKLEVKSHNLCRTDVLKNGVSICHRIFVFFVVPIRNCSLREVSKNILNVTAKSPPDHI